MSEENGSIEPRGGLIPGLCPMAVLIYRTSDDSVWAIALHHRHGDQIDPKPFGVTIQPFN